MAEAEILIRTRLEGMLSHVKSAAT
jgi:hypothetical protein